MNHVCHDRKQSFGYKLTSVEIDYQGLCMKHFSIALNFCWVIAGLREACCQELHLFLPLSYLISSCSDSQAGLTPK